ncbi:hypothetical protein LCGC14_2325130, partial [marine sediment metagenome]
LYDPQYADLAQISIKRVEGKNLKGEVVQKT